MNGKDYIVSPDGLIGIRAPRWISVHQLDDIALRVLADRHGMDLAAEIDTDFPTMTMVVLTEELPKVRVRPVDDHRSAGN